MDWRRNEGVTYRKKTNGTWVSQKVVAVDRETGKALKIKGEGKNKAEAYDNLIRELASKF